MKKFLTLTAVFLITVTVWAQSPKKLSYQAVIRDNNNALVVTDQVGVRISILKGKSKSEVYSETHEPTTDFNGIVTLEIGRGSRETADKFKDIDWSKGGPFFVQTEIDPNGGMNYTLTGVSQLLSVPFALHANSAKTAETADFAEKAKTANKAEKANSAKTANVAKTADQLSETLLFPQSSRTGRYLTVSFSGGKGVNFNGASPTVALQFDQGSPIYASGVHKINNKKVDADFYIPYRAASGTYDILVNPDGQNPKVIKQAFNIYWSN